MDTTKQLRLVLSSVVEPFHFGPAPAPASRDGGSRSSSSSSPVVHNWLLKKRKFGKFHFSIYRACFIHRNVRVLCSSSTYKRDRLILFYIVNIFVISFLYTWGHSWILSYKAGAAPFFTALTKKDSSGSTTLVLSHLSH